jgi:acetyl-CoA carboxylase biotin carboxyl carrier protein
MDIDIEKITALADLVKEKELGKIKVTDGDKSVTIETQAEPVVQQTVSPAMAPMIHTPPAPAQMAALPAQSGAAAPTQASPAADASLHTVTSPMVGTFYSAPSPDSDNFVSVGGTVKAGQTLCIIEAMKLMNELEADIDGTIVEVLVKSGEPVEFGQELFKIKK